MLPIIETTPIRLRRLLRLCLPVCLVSLAIILAPRALAFQADPSVATHSLSIGTLIADIEAGRLADAQYTARFYGSSAWIKLHGHWRSLMAEQQKNREDLGAKRKRFVLLDFYFRHCDQPDQESESQPKMRADFLKLAEELQIAADELPATAATLELLDRCSGPRRLKTTEDEIIQLGQDVIKAVSERPDDGAAWAAVKNVVRDFRFRYFEGKRRNQVLFDYKALIASATTPYSKAQLLSVIRDINLPNELRKTVIAAGLPYLSCDEERASYRLSNEVDWPNNDANTRIALANEIIEAYPRTYAAKVACGRKIAAYASTRGAEQALQALEVDQPKLSLSADEVRNNQLMIANTVAPAVANALLVDFSNQWAGTAQQAQAIEKLFVLAWQKKSAKEVEHWADKRLALLKPNDRLAGNDFAPRLGGFYMAQKRWEKAKMVWSLWVPDNYGCASWDVMPDETQKLQIQTCLLNQNKHREAVESMLKTMDGRVVPALLFYTYDRAGQIEDLKQIVARYLSDPKLAPQQWETNVAFDAEQSSAELSPLHLDPKENWRIPQLFRLRELAQRKDADTLCLFLISYYSNPAFETPPPIPVSDAPMGSILYVEACRLLADMGEESLPAIEKACSNKDPNKSKAWLVRSLLANRSAKAQQLLLKIMDQPNLNISGMNETAVHRALALGARDRELRHGGMTGENMSDNGMSAEPTCGVTLRIEERPVPLTFSWPSAPMGSLPKMTDLFP